MNGCAFCNDMRNIEPAGFIGCPNNKEADQFFRELHKKKAFIWETEEAFYEVQVCPKCGYEFTELDYDRYFE